MKKMKRLIVCSIILTFALLLGCQPTPENEIITNRNDGTLEDIIQMTAPPSNVEIEQQDNNVEHDSAIQPGHDTLNASETWVESLVFGNVTCVINAQVRSINGPKGVYEVEKAPFDDSTIRLFLDHYVANAVEAYPSRDTAEELEQVLEHVLRGEEYEAEDGSLQYRPYDGQEEDAKEINEQIKKARENTETYNPKDLPIDTLPIDYTYVMPTGIRWSIRCNDNKLYARTYRKMSLQSETKVRSGLGREGELAGASIGPISISEEEAIAEAEEVCRQLGAEHLGVARIERGRIIHPYTEDIISKGWIVTFARNDGNCIPVDVSTETTVGLLQYEPSDYAPPWIPERMKIYVDENGIQSIEWSNRVRVKEIVNENVALLSFSDVQEKVRLLLRYGLTWLGTQETTEIRVTEMRLTTLLCNKKDEMNRAYLMPAWVITYENTDSIGTTLSTIIAVNALDGSRMDPLQMIAVAPNH